MNTVTKSQLEFFTSMTPQDLPESRIKGFESSENDLPIVINVDKYVAHKLSSNGKLPRLVNSSKSEKESVELRGRMQEARVRLGREVYKNSLKTLASLRLSRGYSQVQLAEAIGSTQPYIAKLEAGSTNLFLNTAHNLSRALGISIDELYKVINANDIKTSTKLDV